MRLFGVVNGVMPDRFDRAALLTWRFDLPVISPPPMIVSSTLDIRQEFDQEISVMVEVDEDVAVRQEFDESLAMRQAEDRTMAVRQTFDETLAMKQVSEIELTT